MKITLKKQIDLSIAIGYFKLKKEVVREDIKEYLKGKKFENSIINNRIDDYLNRLGINKATVSDTGKVPIEEEGKYKIWYSNNDSHFGNKIFSLLRISAKRREEAYELMLPFSKNSTHFLLERNEYTPFQLIGAPSNIGVVTGEETINFEWILENDKSFYYFSGDINKTRGKNKKRENEEINIQDAKIESDEKLDEIIDKILPYWDKEYRRNRVPFKNISDTNRKNFEDSNYKSKFNGFSVEINKLPLMPKDNDSAKEWRDWLLIEDIKKSYINMYDLQDLALSYNDKEALKPFVNFQSPPTIENLNKNPLLKKNSPEYWHINAPNDLNPNNKYIETRKKKTYCEKEKISLSQIINDLGINDEQPEVIVYYDKYVRNFGQQKKVESFLDAVQCEKKYVITDLKAERVNKHLKKKMSDAVIDCQDIFSKEKPAHDRYIIVGNKDKIKDKIIVWTVTNSIDFISIDDVRSMNKDTVGKIVQSVTYTKIDKEFISQKLVDFISDRI